MSTIFETDRLIIREFQSTDLETTHDYAKLTHVVQHQTWRPNTKADTFQFLQEVLAEQENSPRRKYQFAITFKTEQL